MSTPRAQYLERLRDLLPYREGGRIVAEVEGLLADRVDAERERLGDAEAERQALAALGPPEVLVESLAAGPAAVDRATRRAFVRTLGVLFAGHLLLSVLLTVAGGSTFAIPGLLGPLPSRSLSGVASGVLALFLLDTGAVFLLFACMGRGGAARAFPRVSLREEWRPRDAVLGLVLLGLLALLLHPLRDGVFALQTPDGSVPILSPDLAALVPFATVVLALFAVRQVLFLRARGEDPASVAVDALASLALVALLVLAATRSELVRFPAAPLGDAAAAALGNLVARVLLVVFVGAAVLLAARFVRRTLRFRELLLER
jgi:hypothetical protein